MSPLTAYGMAVLTVALQTYSQLIFKWRVGHVPVPAIKPAALVPIFGQFLADPWILSAITAAFIGMLSWLLALTKLDISLTYPFVALVIPLVALSGALIFAEPLSAMRLLGLAVIVSGVAIVAAS